MTNLAVIRKQVVRAGVKAILEETGSNVILEVIQGYITCPVCGGTDPFCSTCGGNEVVPNLEEIPITAKVVWKKSGQKLFMKGWQETEGDAIVVTYAEVGLYELLNSVKRVYVDQTWCEVKNFYYGGLDNNRIYLTLSEETRDTPRIG